MLTMKHRVIRVLSAFGFGALALAAAGCAYDIGWTDVQEKVASRWVGEPVDAFTLAYGPARAQTALSNGGASYSWVIHRYDRFESDYTDGSDAACEVRIVTGAGGEIETADVLKYPGRGYDHRIYCSRLLEDG